jgi:periplasmic protein TonB
MLAYAPSRRRIAERPSSPNAMLLIACAHIAVIAAVMSAKMDLPRRLIDRPITVLPIPMAPEPPPPTQSAAHPHRPIQPTTVDHPNVPDPAPSPDQPTFDPGPSSGTDVASGGGSSATIPTFTPPKPLPINSGPELLTPESQLRPPYPQSKLLSDEQATLHLRLTIDERGRVIAVDPVGSADPIFLAAARRHLLAHWRYKPAMEDGRAVATSIVVTLRFMLDG